MLESMDEPSDGLDIDEPFDGLDMDGPPDELEDATLNTGSDLAVGCDSAG